VPTVSVLVPTWRRPDALVRCLRAIAAQTAPPAEIVVGLREGDESTTAALDTLAPTLGLPVIRASTPEAGVIAAMNAALVRCSGEVIALTDDDAEPRADWLERAVAALADPAVGGVGGRDWQPLERGDRTDVGRVQWFGRTIGNHHLGAGAARDVDVLKGANAVFRAPLLRAVRFDSRLRGAGAQMFWELGVRLALRRAGWRLVYDPAIAVEHHIAPRHDADQRHRGVFASAPQVDAVHNETLLLLEYLAGARRLAFLAWALAVGTAIEPGLAQLPRLILRGDRAAFARWRATVDGRLAGWQRWRADRDRAREPIPAP
jgi:GT2 family glycosyltransferase